MKPSPIEAAAVVVPVHDEEARLGDCLTAIHEACAGLSLPTMVIVVTDSCTDTSAAIAGHFPGVVMVPTHIGKVGGARGLGMVHAIDRCLVAGDRLWLATTDADSQVPTEWLAQQVDGADHGMDAHVGMVDLATDGVTSQGYGLGWAARRSSHPHVHGANLGVRASAYRAVGGFASIACHEDRDLVDRLDRAIGTTVLRSSDLPVHTSARTEGRAPGGVASDLRRRQAH